MGTVDLLRQDKGERGRGGEGGCGRVVSLVVCTQQVRMPFTCMYISPGILYIYDRLLI